MMKEKRRRLTLRRLARRRWITILQLGMSGDTSIESLAPRQFKTPKTNKGKRRPMSEEVLREERGRDIGLRVKIYRICRAI